MSEEMSPGYTLLAVAVAVGGAVGLWFLTRACDGWTPDRLKALSAALPGLWFVGVLIAAPLLYFDWFSR